MFGRVRPGPATDPAAPYRRAAEPVLTLADGLAGVPGNEADAINRAVLMLDRFSDELRRAGVPGSSILPARLALALLVDHKARGVRAFDMKVWGAAAHRLLFEGRDMTPDLLAEFARKAHGAGPDFAGAAAFLDDCAGRIAGDRQKFDRSTGATWTGIVLVLVAAFALAVLGWAGYVEWRHHRALSQVFEAEALAVGLDRDGTFPDLAQRLDRLAAARDQVAARARVAPVRLFAGVLGFDAAARADATYRAAVRRHLPAAIARAIDDAVATEGEPIAAYDTLRAWQVLSGSGEFRPAYLAGWLSDRALADPLLAGLAGHVGALGSPLPPAPQPDPELLAQARSIAAEATEPQRAFLELKRGDGAAAVAAWQPAPGLAEVVERRSGRPMAAAIPGLFTAAGWDYARDFGAGIAVQTARAEAARLFDAPAETRNDTPDRVMEELQDATLSAWSEFVADLRVRPFADPEKAVFVSGRLSASDTPLVPFLKDVWQQAGGADRRREHTLQLKVATTFGPMIQYVEQGRMTDIAALFAALNVALGAMDRDEETGLQRLMSVQDRAQSIATLRQAPTIVTQIVEDALAQTAAAHADMLTNPLTRAWQVEVLPACRAVEGRFPFGQGADADLREVALLLAPGGAIDRFVTARAGPYLDKTGPEWRWKTEARFSGLDPASAEFLRRAEALSAGLFGAGGNLAADLSLAALAEKGKAFVALGGQGGPVETTAEPLSLAWPGARPEDGIEVSFQTSGGSATLKEPGPWGFYRLFLPLRLRERDEGRRFLVDLRAEGARLFVEITFASPANPLSQRAILKTFACPQVL